MIGILCVKQAWRLWITYCFSALWLGIYALWSLASLRFNGLY